MSGPNASFEATACPFCHFAGPTLHQEAGTIVFEPLDPVTPGHVLVVPTMHVQNAAKEPTVTATTMRVAAWWVQQRVKGDANIITSVGAHATQTVNHLHVHVVPRRAGDGLMLPWSEASA